MTLTEFFEGNSFGGFSSDELSRVLGLRTDYSVKTAPPNGVILADREGRMKPLGCVSKYFTNDENGRKVKEAKSSSSTGACYYIQKALGCRHATPGECRTCFLSCLALHEAGEVYRRKTK